MTTLRLRAGQMMDSIQIVPITRTKGALGDDILTEGTIVSRKCRITMVGTASSDKLADGLMVFQQRKIVLRWDSELSVIATDKVIIRFDSKDWQVLEVFKPESQRPPLLLLMVEEKIT